MLRLLNEKQKSKKKTTCFYSMSNLQKEKISKILLQKNFEDLWQKTMHQSNAFSKYFKGKNGSEVGRRVQKKTIKEDKEGIQGGSYGLYEKGLETRQTSLENRSKSTSQTIRGKKNKSWLRFGQSEKWTQLFKLQARTQGSNGETFRQEIKKRRSYTSHKSQQARQSVIKYLLNDFIRTQKTSFEGQLTQSLTIS